MQNYKPSDFAKLGIPYCSIWGKAEIEYLAWGYITALANSGDVWGKKLTPQQCFDLLTKDQRKYVQPYLTGCICGGRAKEWEDIVRRLIDSDGALEVGGLAWNKYQIDKQKTSIKT